MKVSLDDDLGRWPFCTTSSRSSAEGPRGVCSRTNAPPPGRGAPGQPHTALELARGVLFAKGSVGRGKTVRALHVASHSHLLCPAHVTRKPGGSPESLDPAPRQFCATSTSRAETRQTSTGNGNFSSTSTIKYACAGKTNKVPRPHGATWTWEPVHASRLSSAVMVFFMWFDSTPRFWARKLNEWLTFSIRGTCGSVAHAALAWQLSALGLVSAVAPEVHTADRTVTERAGMAPGTHRSPSSSTRRRVKGRDISPLRRLVYRARPRPRDRDMNGRGRPGPTGSRSSLSHSKRQSLPHHSAPKEEG